MVDRERIGERLSRLDPLLSRLALTQQAGLEACRFDPDERLRAERALQLAIQVCLDVAAHLVAELGRSPPDEYRQTFVRLGEAGVLEADLARRLADAAGLRNLLVHGYADLDDAAVFAALHGLDDLRAFAATALAVAERA